MRRAGLVSPRETRHKSQGPKAKPKKALRTFVGMALLRTDSDSERTLW